MKLIERSLGFIRKKGVVDFFRVGWNYFDLKLNFLRFFEYLSLVGEVKLLMSENRQGEAVDKLFDFKYLSPGQIKSEFECLLKVIEKLNPKNIFEIGTSNGGSLFLLAQFSDPSAKVVSIDLPGGGFGGGYPFWKKHIYARFGRSEQELILIRGDSHSDKVLSQVKEIFADKAVDFLFIDADHTYEGVKRDFETYAPFVRKGGVVAFHDVALPPDDAYGTNKFWLEIKDQLRTQEFVENRSQKGYGIGIIFK